MENKKLDKFEKFIKSNLENYKPEYDPKMWDDFQQKNAKSSLQNPTSYLNKFLVGAVTFAVVAVAYYVYNNNENTSTKTEEIAIKTSNVEVENKIENIELSETNKQIDDIEKPENKSQTKSTSSFGQKQPKNSEVVNTTNTNTTTNKKEELLVDESNETKQIEKEANPLEEKAREDLKIASTEEMTKEESKESNAILVSKNEACIGEDIKMEALNSKENNTWLIDGKVIAKNSKTLTHAFEKEGEYEVTFKSGSEKISEKITVFAPVEKKILWKVDDFSNNLVVEFQVESEQDLNSYHWDFGDKQYSNEANPKHAYIGNGNYEVELKSTDNNNCKSTIKETVMLNVKNPLLAPTAFTPDGDGLNDYFIPKALEVRNDINFEMFIYDNQGNLVYKTDNKNEPWNGKNNNTGEVYRSGSTFLWVVKLNDELGRTGNFMGSVTILNK